MMMPMTVRQVADLVGGTVLGQDTAMLAGLASLESAGPGELTFADARHASALSGSKAGAALVASEVASAPMPLILVENVQTALATLLGHLAGPEDLPPVGVHPSATIAEDAKLGQGVCVGPGVAVGSGASVGDGTVLCANVTVGRDVQIGENCILFEGVVIRHSCRLGSRVRIGSNSVIGYEGFGYYHAQGVHHRVPHAGTVVIEDDVDLGACCCVDRSKFGSTRVGEGSKIDNLVQIAHGVQVGPLCLLAAQVGIAGSTKLGAGVIIGGAAGIRDNISLGRGSQVAAKSAVAADVPEGQMVAGMPAMPAKDAMRQVMAIGRLPDLLKQVREIEARIVALEAQQGNQQA